MALKNAPARPASPQDALMDGFKKDLEQVNPYINALVPYKGGVEKFRQMTLLALVRSPGLLQADRKSLLLAILWCAQKDLEPGVEDGAWLIPFKGKVVPIPAYKGLIKKAVETGSALDVDPQAVFENDDFSYTLGLEPDIRHIPPRLGDDRGALVGAYVVITLPNGDKKFRVLDRPSIEKIRNAGAAWKAAPDSGPWHDWEEAMYLKTVIKQGLKTVPVKPAYRDLIYDDGRIEAGSSVAALMHEAGVDLPKELEAPDLGPETRPKDEPGPKLDTSAFDHAVKKLKWDKETLARLDKWLAATAKGASTAASTRDGREVTITPDMIKVSCGNRFEEFLTKFKEWQEVTYPAAEAPPVAPGAEGGPAEKAEAEAAAGDEGPEQEPAAEPRPLEARRQAVWDQVINKGIPLASLAVLDPPVSAPGHITEQNVAEAEELVATYQAPTGKGKK